MLFCCGQFSFASRKNVSVLCIRSEEWTFSFAQTLVNSVYKWLPFCRISMAWVYRSAASANWPSLNNCVPSSWAFTTSPGKLGFSTSFDFSTEPKSSLFSVLWSNTICCVAGSSFILSREHAPVWFTFLSLSFSLSTSTIFNLLPLAVVVVFPVTTLVWSWWLSYEVLAISAESCFAFFGSCDLAGFGCPVSSLKTQSL